MALEFVHPWFGLAAVALLLPTLGLGLWRRRLAPLLFGLAGVLLLAAAAGPQLGVESSDVLHAIVLDVSDSVASRQSQLQAQAGADIKSVDLPPGHSLLQLQLSDAVRDAGQPRGGPTHLQRLADALSRPGMNGELVLYTDGRARPQDLALALDPRRVILVPITPPAHPDAAILALRAPSMVAAGVVVTLSADIACDIDAEVKWKFLRGESEIASGTRLLAANQPVTVSTALIPANAGLQWYRIQLDLPADREPRNDSAQCAVVAGGKRVVVFTRDPAVPEASDALLALLSADPRNEVRVTDSLPVAAGQLQGVDLLVIHDLALARSGADASQLETLAQWVGAGGSVLMCGADAAFGPGGYRGTRLEDVMPVKFWPDDAPARHVLLLLDTSASMQERTAGGARKLDLLQAGAARFVRSLQPADSLAVVGFSGGLTQAPVFVPVANSTDHQAAIDRLAPAGRTLIRQSLAAALEALAPHAGSANAPARLMLVTDGEEGEAVAVEAWQQVAARVAELGLRLDVVLTDANTPVWLQWLVDAPSRPDVHVVGVGSGGFDDLLRAMEEAMAAYDKTLVRREPMKAAGLDVALPVLVRTSLRQTDSVQLDAGVPKAAGGQYPLLSRRQLVGRTGAICAPGAGDQAVSAFWQQPAWQAQVSNALQWLLETAGRPNLILSSTPEGAELLWVGSSSAPTGDLRTSQDLNLPRLAEGRWRLDPLPDQELLVVLDGDRELQRIALPKLPAPELRLTGNDSVFFAQAEAAGFRVMSSLAAWHPRRFEQPAEQPFALDWLLALAATGLLLAGYALRKRP
ncbi:MAG: VWA domain-containing protein [Planctomycetes bacterium]|nr:VWA domain-containing protein [Planctomycetota bacterium]